MSKKLLSVGFVGFSFLVFGVGVYAADLPESSLGVQEGTPISAFETISSSPTSTTQEVIGYPTPIGENSGVLSEANRFYQGKHFFDAEKLYNLYVSQNAQYGVSTDLALAYHRLGLIAKRRQLYDKAQQYLISAIKSDPMKDPQITLDYAIILFELGEYERAEKLFRFLSDNNPDMEQAKIYLGKTLLEIDPSIDLLPLLEAEYGRVEAGELLAARCRAAGKTDQAEKLEKMIFDEKVKGDEVFFVPADPAVASAGLPAPSADQLSPSEPVAPGEVTTPAPADNSADFEAFAATIPSVTESDVYKDSDFAPFRTDDTLNVPFNGGETYSGLPSQTLDAAQEARDALTSDKVAETMPFRAPRTDTLGGFPGLSMNDQDGTVLQEADPAYAEAEPVEGKMAEQFAPFVDYERETSVTLAETRRGISVPRTEEMNYDGFDGYLPPKTQRGEVSNSAVSSRASIETAPSPDFGFVDEICFQEPEKVALAPRTPKSRATISTRTSPKASPLTNTQAVPLQNAPAPQPATPGTARRFSSDEKLRMAEKAGAKITYLTSEEYDTEIATRAGRMVQHAEEEISNSNLQEDEKQALIQKILGL